MSIEIAVSRRALRGVIRVELYRDKDRCQWRSAGIYLEGLIAQNLNCSRRQVDRIFKFTSAGFAEPHVPNTMFRHMFGRFRCDHISTTQRTALQDVLLRP